MILASENRRINIFTTAMLLVMALSFAVKAAIPAGFMPDSKGGFTKLVICSGMGEKTVYVPADENPASGEKHASSADHCPYQTLTTAKIIPAPSIPLTIGSVIVAAEQVSADQIFLPALPLHSLAARGPPSLLI